MIIDKLIGEIIKKQSPIVVGLDPKEEFIPQFILEENILKYGKTIKALCESFYTYNKMIIDEIHDLVPSVKPQIAMYEKYGYEGIKCYMDTIAYAKEKGLIVISDIKRGDIASTGLAYAEGHLGDVSVFGKSQKVFDADFATVNPYLGCDSIEPFLEVMKKTDTGIFLLVKTSNKGSKDIQDIQIGNDKLFEKVGDLVENMGKEFIGKYGFSSVGAVVGGTHKDECSLLRQRLKNTFFLIPGYGAQGGKADDIKMCFNKDGLGGIVNSSRGIITAYKKDEYKVDEKDFAKASRQAVLDMREDLKM